MNRTIAALAIAASTLVTGMSAAQAQALLPQAHHDGFRSVAAHGPGRVVAYGDTDSANARNPALPSYEQGRGQETGGPARELIGR